MARDIDTCELENEAARLLTALGATVATAESCTGGLIAKRLTDVPGASVFFPGGLVSYSVQAKRSLLGVDPALMQSKGVVSSEVALAMADGARSVFGADVGIGVTGVAGPGADPAGVEPGTVYVALTAKSASHCELLHANGNREQVRTEASSKALDMLIDFLENQEIN